MQRKFDIGDEVTFTYLGQDRVGRIVGYEFVEHSTRWARGWRYVIASDGECIPLSERSIQRRADVLAA